MTKMTKLFAAAAAMTVALNASAGTSSAEASYVDVQSDVPGVLTLAQFNTNLGTLQSVKFELFDKLTGFVELENLGATAGNFTVSLTGKLSSSFGDIDAVYSDKFLLAGGQYQLTDIGLATASYSHTYTSAADLQNFINGPLVFSVTGKVTPNFSGPANASYYAEGTIDAYAKVTYTYATAPVPEPETYAMLLAGLGLVGVIARRRKSA